MTDPDAARNEPEDENPPPRPPRPAASAQLSQLEADELYARQLAEHFDNVSNYEARTANRSPGGRVRRQQTGLEPRSNAEDREHNFFDDELPVIQEKLRKGFMETQGKVNNWITTMKKRFDEEFADDDEHTQRPPQAQGHYGKRPGESSRRSGDYERYDADPQVLSDDFAGMKFTADGSECAPAKTPFDAAASEALTRSSSRPRQQATLEPRPLQAPSALEVA